MSIRNATLVAIACLVSGRALADEVWSCSIVDDGKPQVIKFRAVAKEKKVMMSDWRTRLMGRYSVNKDGEDALRLIADTNESMVAVSDVRTNREAGTLQETSMDTYAIDKYTGQLTITTANTGHPAGEIKGNCAR
jgi:hypothetical protein